MENDLLRNEWTDIRKDESGKLIYKGRGDHEHVKGEVQGIFAMDDIDYLYNNPSDGIEVTPYSKIPLGTQRYVVKLIESAEYEAVSSGMPFRFYTWPKSFKLNEGHPTNGLSRILAYMKL